MIPFRSFVSSVVLLLLVLLLLITPTFTAPAAAQGQIPPSAGLLLFCGVQATPAPDARTVLVDDVAVVPAPTFVANDARCTNPAHVAFTLPAGPFSVRAAPYRVVVVASNAFGTTPGQEFLVTIGVAPGAFTIAEVRLISGGGQ